MWQLLRLEAECEGGEEKSIHKEREIGESIEKNDCLADS